MITILIVAAALALIYVVIKQLIGSKPGPSIDLAETLLPKEDIHAEIAKTVETIKAQEPIVTEKPKRKPAAKKPATPKMKATPKKKK
jgi:hypothetical protein